MDTEGEFSGKRYFPWGSPSGVTRLLLFLETAKTMELQKFQNEDDKQSGLV